ncbi:preprotein translocase subunit SecF [Actinopolymorpha cephalotaxi]|uniref:Protein-export membrane protein SecF n=1 Tax=Actinopolymorpha cephalotaxi TaxID=504797 RepID=A0A1I2PT41_9ACTN|nr:protein translocase subunit SecF [Actinopolymorpha cephalotaxi]NYH83480.1 preprotein translocase subunit SecF [Actinopolymorpha cephalotaxi]SFG19292.1 preprotein translocase subunit SecF [Actinopolymorpha cephalotaxi]
MSRLGAVGHKLYTGEVSLNFVGRRKLWYLISAVVLVIAIGAVLIRGLAFSIEFRGGVDFQAPVASGSAQNAIPGVRTAVVDTGVLGRAEPIVTSIGANQVRVETPPLSTDNIAKARTAIAKQLKVGEGQIDYSSIGPTWGAQITDKALLSLGVFLVLVMGVIWLYFREWRMSVSGLVALLHDVAITVGIYALVGFDVTPATIIGVLTILGYSLYDTVVVFDKVRENTRSISSGSRWTYSEAANLAVNQTLVRSINTSIIALLPVAGILFVGAGLLGAGTLKDLSLALFIGIAVGTYSSIFIATPLLCDLKEREPAMRALSRRVEQRRAGAAAKSAASGSAGPAAVSGTPGGAEGGEPAASGEDQGANGTRQSVPATSRAQGRPAGRPQSTSSRSAGRSQPQRKPRSTRRPKGHGR